MSDFALLLSAYIVDLIIGDPRWIPHPVKGIGWCIEKTEHMLRRKITGPGHRAGDTEQRIMESRERLAGCVLTAVLTGLTFVFFSAVSMVLLRKQVPAPLSYLFMGLFVYLLSTTVATRGLISAGQQVVDELNAGHVMKARKKLRMIVGRDTDALDRKGILRATVETLAENASDGIVAPLFYFAIGGLPLAMTYKTINTLDSMVGYKNEQYRHFGWASARLDDFANFLPARITGMSIVISALLVRAFMNAVEKNSMGRHQASGMDAFKIMCRDGRNHTSPNSGIPEAAMAGALGLKLGGPSTYGGVVSEKPFIGDEKHGSVAAYLFASETALTIIKVTSVLGLCIALVIVYLRKSLWS